MVWLYVLNGPILTFRIKFKLCFISCFTVYWFVFFFLSFTENQVVCTTSESSEELSDHVTLRFDDAPLPLEFRREFFKYVTNPTVTKIVEEKRKSIVR